MCYHTQYIFLACGHSVSSVRPIRPSPPCPYREESTAINTEIDVKIEAPQRPFSFDPSVIASPISEHPEPFPAHTPWRLEEPFSPIDAATSTAILDENGEVNEIVNAGENYAPHTVSASDAPTIATPVKRDSAANKSEKAQQQIHCGQILHHPYRSYKIEGPCLHCRQRRDNLLASFEINSIKETVYREAAPGAKSQSDEQRRFIARLSAYQLQRNGEMGRGEDRIKALPLQAPIPISVPALRKFVHFDEVESVEREEGHVHRQQPQQQQQQQQTPWRLTLPPAEVPRIGSGLAGMRDGEWI